MDKFKVEVITQTPNPQQLIYAAMHQDYSPSFVAEERFKWPSEEQCGEIIINRLLAGGRGHYGCIEHPQITFNCGYFPHSVIQQGRTHRLTSWDVQSARYTSSHILQAASGEKDIDEVFYLRPVGDYTDRQGKNYYYSAEQRQQDLEWCLEAAKRYAAGISQGMSEEHTRGLIPFDYRQHFIVSFNARAFLHFMDLRSKKDAQLEIQKLCELMWPHFKVWMPAIADWYEKNRLGKARLAP